MISDAEIGNRLVEEALGLVKDKQRLKSFSEQMKKMGTPNATKDIVEVIVSLIDNG
jgi:UDP-N-acetylglucosamine--N-acetylmuramyl-(pentapeptide) pyrophosphoryl-undecaprenol N-acetylglucosamine transferase